MGGFAMAFEASPPEAFASKLVWLPCEIKSGMFSNERLVVIHIEGAKPEELYGFVSQDDVNESERKVKAQLLGQRGDKYILRLGGEFEKTNMMIVPQNILLGIVGQND